MSDTNDTNDTNKDTVVGNILEVPLESIFADETFNCRGHISAVDVIDLARDIESHGLIQPVTVAPYKNAETPQFKYKLIAGYRRMMAHIVIKHTVIKAIVNDSMVDETKARVFNLSENLQRQDLSIMQEANAIQRVFQLGIGLEQMTKLLNKSFGWVQVRVQLLKLPELVQKEVAQGYIPQTQIRDLYSIYNASGEEATFEAVKVLKDAKIKGLKNASIKPKSKKEASKKRKRTPGEVLEFMFTIQDTIGNGFHTRVLAWVAGEVSDVEIHTDLRELAESKGITYNIPSHMMEDLA